MRAREVELYLAHSVSTHAGPAALSVNIIARVLLRRYAPSASEATTLMHGETAGCVLVWRDF